MMTLDVILPLAESNVILIFLGYITNPRRSKQSIIETHETEVKHIVTVGEPLGCAVANSRLAANHLLSIADSSGS